MRIDCAVIVKTTPKASAKAIKTNNHMRTLRVNRPLRLISITILISAYNAAKTTIMR